MNKLNVKKTTTVLAHAFAGWALCAAITGIGQAITMPLFFASNAIYPIDIMPGWLKAVAIANPLSYVVDAMRALVVQHRVSAGLGE